MPRRITPKATIRPESRHVAAAYVRESGYLQELGASPAVQRAKIAELAVRLGLVVPEDRWRQEVERGSVIDRPGYQEILSWARAGEISHVLVFTLSRWGRRTHERIRARDELRERGVVIWSVLQGEDVPGLASDVNAAVDEEYSRALGKVVRPNKEASARRGIAQGPTPYGYTRVYPAYEGKRRPWGRLVKHPTTGPVVRDRIFGGYARGDVSIRGLARALNADPAVPPPRDEAHPHRAARFSQEAVRNMLVNEIYAGTVGYNERPVGIYDRAGADEYFEVAGQHEPLVDLATFARVQALLTRHALRPGTIRQGPETALLTGLLVCDQCGGPMRPAWTHGRTYALYRCARQIHGATRCSPSSYRAHLAHAAILADVARLAPVAWSPRIERRVEARTSDAAAALAAACAERDTALTAADDYAARLPHLTDFSEAAMAVFRAHAEKLAAASADANARVRALRSAAPRMVAIKARHADIARALSDARLRDLLADPDFDSEHDADARVLARRLALQVIERATLTGREKITRPAWLTFDITWNDDVGYLLGVGALRLRESGRL